MSTINDMITWQAKARPEPTARQFDVAVGVHIEEFVEMLDSLESKVWAWSTTRESLHNISKALKAGGATCQIKDRVALLDALCDQVVTASGVAHCAGFQFESALQEVNRSNWSKFVDGEPQFDANGKISKGPHYSKACLDPFAI